MNEDKLFNRIGTGIIAIWIVGLILSLATSVAVIWLIVAGIQYLGSH